jgi:hypothetical protein
MKKVRKSLRGTRSNIWQKGAEVGSSKMQNMEEVSLVSHLDVSENPILGY